MEVSVNSPMSAGMPYSSSKANRQAAAPAPPVMISVPSMSNSAAIRLLIRSSYGRPWLWHDELDRAAEAEVERLLQRDVKEADLLELLGTVERADVDGPVASLSQVWVSTGLVMSTTTLPASWSAYCWTASLMPG
jgi:hypothetical protein